MVKYYGNLTSEPDELELKNRALARRAAAEGFVLLKNEGGALPLSSKKVALYGMGARKTVKGGLGSGSVEERYSVNIEEGLKNAGYEITSGRWLDDYDREYTDEYTRWHDFVEDQVKDLNDMPSIIVKAHSYVFRYPSGRAVTEEDVRESDTDTAVYVVMRQAGECNDRKLEKGDYYLTDIERENLAFLGKAYKHTILIINVGGLIDLSFLDDTEGIDAVVLFVQGGEEGGNALADVLSGKENFSGKLTDTVPMKYEDIPFGESFSYLGGDLKNAYYDEGIYVGYRYFDSFRVPVRFPFGFGLSYTSFEISAEGLSFADGRISLLAAVKNTGGVPGKEVVQVYVCLPKGRDDKEFKRLTAYAKTETLEPLESCSLELSFALEDLASYDEIDAQFYLDAGDYAILVGNSSADAKAAGILRLSEKAVTLQCKNCMPLKDEIPEFVPISEDSDESRPEITEDSVPVICVDATSIKKKTVDYTEPGYEESPGAKKILDGLTIKEQAQLLRGGDLQRPPKGAFDIAGAGGKTSTALLDKGITNVIFCDGPAGINIVNEVFAMPDGSFAAAQVPERYDWGKVAKGMKAYLSKIEAPKVRRYATAWPVSMLRAQTWNTKLIEEIGDAVGAEMEKFGITVWLAPGMNIHRNPLGGRTFEYYSEDPVVSGKTAAALTRGVQRHKGCFVSIKHFCCNNIEDNRFGVSANVSERTLREIYLKGFEIAVKESAPATVMSSYNLVNHTYTANSHELLTDILRCEWGFCGLVMTDWGSCDAGRGDPALCVPAGNDLIMPGKAADYEAIVKAVDEGEISPGQVRKSAGRVLELMLASNTFKQAD